MNFLGSELSVPFLKEQNQLHEYIGYFFIFFQIMVWGMSNGHFADDAIIRFIQVQHQFQKPDWNWSVVKVIACLKLLLLKINKLKNALFISGPK